MACFVTFFWVPHVIVKDIWSVAKVATCLPLHYWYRVQLILCNASVPFVSPLTGMGKKKLFLKLLTTSQNTRPFFC